MTKSIAALDRLLAKVQEAPNGCWEWVAGSQGAGYGAFWYEGRCHPAHRISWELFLGPIPDGLVLDHLCRNRGCVNPWHLEPVTHQVNILRGEGAGAKAALVTECPQGHPYDEANTHFDPRGYRRCRTCRRKYNTIHKRTYRARLRAARQTTST